MIGRSANMTARLGSCSFTTLAHGAPRCTADRGQMIPFTKGYLGLSTLGQIHGSALPRTVIPGLLSFFVTLAMFYIPSNDPVLAESGNKTWRHYWVRLMPDWKVSRRVWWMCLQMPPELSALGVVLFSLVCNDCPGVSVCDSVPLYRPTRSTHP